MKTSFLIILFTILSVTGYSQELYPYAEPASNMPAKSISVKSSSVFHGDVHSGKTIHRHMPEVMLGLNKNWMFHLGANFSNMYRQYLYWEAVRLYGKYRFLSIDDVHKHFRMAVFGGAAYSRNPLEHNEINLMMGDQTGVQAGLIATQLWNKLAISATGAWNEVLNEQRWDKTMANMHAVRSVNYSLSAGYLLLPFEYTDYDQTNLNLYVELLGSRNINFPSEKYYLDLAPSIQAIFNSTAKLNLAYRFELNSDIFRMTKNSWMISFEYIFLNALKKRSK